MALTHMCYRIMSFSEVCRSRHRFHVEEHIALMMSCTVFPACEAFCQWKSRHVHLTETDQRGLPAGAGIRSIMCVVGVLV